MPWSKAYTIEAFKIGFSIELVHKKLNHLAAILHFYAGSLIFMKWKKTIIIFQKEKGNTVTFFIIL